MTHARLAFVLPLTRHIATSPRANVDPKILVEITTKRIPRSTFTRAIVEG